MREGTPSTIYLKDYQPLAFQIDSIELRVELEPTSTRVS